MRLVLLLGCFSLVAAMIGCTPATIAAPPDVESVEWNSERYKRYEEKWDSIVETSGTDTLSYRAMRHLKKLFALSVDWRNPTPNYEKSIEYAQVLSGVVGSEKNVYENWRLILQWVVKEDNASGALNRKVKQLKASNAKLTKMIADKEKMLNARNKAIVDLRKKVAEQEATIEKLKKLEVLMEEERNRY